MRFEDGRQSQNIEDRRGRRPGLGGLGGRADVWGHYAAARGRLEVGDLEEGLNAAAAIGDDTIQKRTQGRVSPESWTHGSSADRARWFRQGLESGQIAACNTEGR